MCTGKYVECSKVVTSKPTRRMTKREQRVMALHDRLPELSKAQRKFMMQDFPMVGYYWKRGEVWCQHCGHVEKVQMPELAVSLEYDDYICPVCGQRLTLKHYAQKGGKRDEEYLGQLKTVVTTIGGQQVFRTYLSERRNVKGEPTEYQVHDIYENWVDEQGREVILSRQYSRSLWHMRWEYYSPWSVKHHNGNASGYYVTSDIFDISGNYFYPDWRMSKTVMRNGWRREFQMEFQKSVGWRISPVLVVQNLLLYPECEMLAKTGQTEMFYYACSKGRTEMAKYMPSIRICNRNKYVIKDPGIWCDYIDMLEYFGKDVRNAHYVCPSDLRAAHDRLLKKKIDREFREKLTKDIAKSVKYEENYRKAKGRFFGVCFGNEHITVTVICSVKEMAMEGAAMHHCVYANAYYKKKNSLILSAKDSRGLRLETIEVSLRTWQVLQSRGVCNNPTEFHDEIIRLVEENMYQLKKVA